MDMFLLQVNRCWTRKKNPQDWEQVWNWYGISLDGAYSIKCSSPRQTVLVSNSCLLCQVNAPQVHRAPSLAQQRIRNRHQSSCFLQSNRAMPSRRYQPHQHNLFPNKSYFLDQILVHVDHLAPPVGDQGE